MKRKNSKSGRTLTWKQIKARWFAGEMRNVRARAAKAPGGKGPIAKRPAAMKLRKKLGLNGPTKRLTKKQLAQRKYAARMKTLRQRAAKTPGGKGPIANRPQARKLREKLGLETAVAR